MLHIVTCTVSTTQCKLLERKYGICASGWKEKHHQCKLQWVKPPRVQVEYLCQLLREKHHHQMGAGDNHRKDKVQRSGPTQRKSERDAATTCNSNHHHHRPVQDQHGCWWSAQCSNHCNLRKGTQFKFLSTGHGRNLRSSNLHCVVVVLWWWRWCFFGGG